MTDTPATGSRKAGSLDRVRRYLEQRGHVEDLLVFDDRSTKTCELAANAVGCEIGQIVKSLVFVAGDRPVLALVAGDRRGDTAAIAGLMGCGEVRFADAETVRAATGYAIGGVSPFDLPEELVVLVDDSLQRFDVVYTAAGTPNSMVRFDRDALFALVGGQVAQISRES